MATFPTPVTIQQINPISRSKELGLFPYCGGYIDSVTGVPKLSNGAEVAAFKYLVVRGTAGDIVVQLFNDLYDVIPACEVGSWKLYCAKKVVFDIVVINGQNYQTDAVDIWWKGGVGAGA